jgi:hypothetical protein
MLIFLKNPSIYCLKDTLSIKKWIDW